MRQIRRIPALLLAVVMLCSLTLTGCGKKEAPVPGDQVAVALFEMILKDDASKAVELFGYADEAEAREDMGLEIPDAQDLGGLQDEAHGLFRRLLRRFVLLQHGVAVIAGDNELLRLDVILLQAPQKLLPELSRSSPVGFGRIV